MKHRLVMFDSHKGGHPIGVLPESVVAVEHIVQDATAALAGVAAATVIHLISGVSLQVVGAVADVVDSLSSKSMPAKGTAESTAAPGAPAETKQ